MNLPTEIYLRVFSFLNKWQLEECITVCKAWSSPALTMFYRDLVVTESTVKTVKAFLIDQDARLNNCAFVEKLSFHDCRGFSISQDPSELTSAQFIEFIKYFPNVKTIDVKSMYTYATYLLDVDSDKHLKKIEKIEVERTPFGSVPKLNHIYYHFKSSLKYLNVTQDSIICTRYESILNYLKQFKNLIHLEYYNYTDNQVTLYQLQVACPTLNVIKFGCSEVPSLGTVHNKFYSGSNLKALTLYFPYFPASYIDLIMNHLPTSVETLIIDMDDINLFDWIHKVGMERVLKLANCMSHLPHAGIRCTPDKEYEQEFENEQESDMTVVFKVLNSFIGNKKKFCSFESSDFRSVHNSMSFSDNNLRIYYGLKFKDIYEGQEEENEKPMINFALPDKSISMSGTEIINKLVFTICHRNDNFPYGLLKYALINFPFLQHAEYKGMNYPKHSFLFCKDSEDIRSYYQSLTGDPNNPTTTQENLKVAMFDQLIPHAGILNLMATYLPNLKILSCGVSRIYRGFHDEEENTLVKPNTMDLTPFKHLEIVYFDVNLIFNQPEAKTCYIIFEFNDGEAVKYKYTGKKDISFQAISLDNQDISIPTMTFKCHKIRQFTLRNSERYKLIDILQGIPQENRDVEVADFRFMGQF